MKNSAFWEYFSKTLNWPLLRSKYLQVLVKGLAKYMDGISQDIAYVRNQYIVDTSDEGLLDDYAISRGIKRLPTDTPEQYKSRVLNAYRWQKYAGKETGLPFILEEYGYPGAVVEYFYKDSEGEKGEKKLDSSRWAEFAVNFSGTYGQDQQSIVPLINEFKPARSKLGLLVTPAHVEGEYTVLGYSQMPDRITSVKEYIPAHYTLVGVSRIYESINSYSNSRTTSSGEMNMLGLTRLGNYLMSLLRDEKK